MSTEENKRHGSKEELLTQNWRDYTRKLLFAYMI